MIQAGLQTHSCTVVLSEPAPTDRSPHRPSYFYEVLDLNSGLRVCLASLTTVPPTVTFKQRTLETPAHLRLEAPSFLPFQFMWVSGILLIQGV